jgi:hypothetical protein
MTKFADELFADLMHEHGSALEVLPARARRTAPRPLWLAAGVVGMAGAITAGITVFSGGAPAYAVTDNSDGTTTIMISQLSAIADANGTLHNRGDRMVVVPVRAGCPAFDSLPVVQVNDRGRPLYPFGFSGSDSITVDAHGVPAGDTAVIAVQTYSNEIVMESAVIKGPVPSCVTVAIGQFRASKNGGAGSAAGSAASGGSAGSSTGSGDGVPSSPVPGS